tara:strand:+ start:7513 stop:8127 length:615 start_codon:yes stop_codon:yes gene_type:complete
MMHLGEIRVRILGVGCSPEWSPSSLYLETDNPGIKQQYIPIKDNDNGWWEIIAPITESNLKFCEDHLYMTRGYLLQLNRRELRNPFNKNKQAAWFEEDLKAIEIESTEHVKDVKAQEVKDARETALKLLRSYSLQYHTDKKKNEEFGWPIPDKSEAMFELEESLGGIVDMNGSFMQLKKADLKESHSLELEEINERKGSDRSTF